jgi:hypothetical protein
LVGGGRKVDDDQSVDEVRVLERHPHGHVPALSRVCVCVSRG